MIHIKLDSLKENQRGIYCVPGKVILDTHNTVPCTYLGLMRYTNSHHEIVTSVRYLAEFMALKPTDTKNGINERVRNALQILKNLHVLSAPSFGDQRFSVNECFMLKFARGFGWNYAASAQAYGCGYVKDSEIERLRKKFLNGERDYQTSFCSALQFLLFARLFMEKPAGRTGLKQVEEGASAILTEEQIMDACKIKAPTIIRRLASMHRYGLLDYAVRYVREGKRTRRKRMYIVCNKTRVSKKTLRVAERALKNMFAVVERMETPDSVEEEA